MKKIGIIGGGEIGNALFKIVSKTSETILWDPNPERNISGKTKEEALSSNIIFFCVPSWVLRPALQDSNINPEAILVFVSKGLDESGKNALEIAREYFPHNKIAFMGGPMLAEEISIGKPGFAHFGTDPETFENLKEVFQDSQIRLSFSEDLNGVAFMGVLKNIYSLGLGIVDALQMGDNFKGNFVSLSTREASKIILLLGGKEETVLGPAGLGDLLGTGYSKYSKNREIGEEAVKGEYDHKSEGVVSLVPIAKLIPLVDYPILNAVHSIFVEHTPPKDAFSKF